MLQPVFAIQVRADAATVVSEARGTTSVGNVYQRHIALFAD
jgi:hypothetical protein